MGKDKARTAALSILRAVLDEGAYYNLAQKDKLANLAAEEKKFAVQLSALTLERLVTIDYYLHKFIRGRVHTLVLHILRLGACQLMYMRVPESAAVNESVELAKVVGKGALSGFVNGVLRNFARNYASVELPEDADERLSVQYGFPLWIVRKFTAQWGREEAERFFAYRPDPRETCVRVNTLLCKMEDFETFLKDSALEYRRGALAPEAYYIRGMSDLEHWQPYAEGLVTAMGEASMTAVRAAMGHLAPGASVLDACSAPGGKAAYAAALMGNNIGITAWDLHEHRAELIRRNFTRLGVQNARVEPRDAVEYDAALAEKFDLVMVDAPCSALGLLHGKPDIRHHRHPEDIAGLAVTQAKLLSVCSRYVQKGGTLAYFTCTLAKEENEDVVTRFLSENEEFAPGRPCLPEVLQGARAKRNADSKASYGRCGRVFYRRDGEKNMNLLGSTIDELKEAVAALGGEPYRAKQIYARLMKGVPVAEMTELPISFRQKLLEAYREGFPQVVKKLTAADGTAKYLFGLSDGNAVESVLMQYKYGNTGLRLHTGGLPHGLRILRLLRFGPRPEPHGRGDAGPGIGH